MLYFLSAVFFFFLTKNIHTQGNWNVQIYYNHGRNLCSLWWFGFEMRPCGFFLGFDYYVRVLQVSDFYLKGILFSHISDVLNIFLSFFFKCLF